MRPAYKNQTRLGWDSCVLIVATAYSEASAAVLIRVNFSHVRLIARLNSTFILFLNACCN